MFRRLINRGTSRQSSPSPSMAVAPNRYRRVHLPRLPPEILALICELLVSTYRLPAAGYSSMMWIAILQVSREWRETAVGLLKIWRYIDLTYPTWAYQLLERSTRVPGPVTVALQLNPSLNHARLQRIYQMLYALPRYTSARTLEVCVDGNMAAFLSLLEGPSFSGHLTVGQISNLVLHLGPSVPPVAYPTERILQAFPNLNLLELWECPLAVTPSLPVLQRLVSIKIAFTECSFARQTAVHTLLPILGCAPALRTLHLENCIAFYNSHPPSHVNLPNLSTLFIESDDVNACGHLLDHLTLPPTAFIEVNSIFKDDWMKETIHMLPVLSRFTMNSAPGYPAIHSFEFWDLDDRLNFTFITWGSETRRSNTNARAQGGPRIKFKGIVDYGGEGSSGSDMLKLLVNTLRPDDLRSLRISMYPELNRKEWTSIFSPFQYLTNLYVYADKDPGLLAALSTPQRHGSSTLCFRALQNLTVENWNFGAVDRKGRSCYEQIKVCLNTRQQYRMPLHSLSLVMCRLISARQVNQLGKIVRVHWDGIENNMDSDDESDSDED